MPRLPIRAGPPSDDRLAGALTGPAVTKRRHRPGRPRENAMRHAVVPSPAGTGPSEASLAAAAGQCCAALRHAKTRAVLRAGNGSIAFTDGPFAETKEAMVSF